MIPASHITIDGDTALWVFDENGPAPQFQSSRPCDTCGGSQWDDELEDFVSCAVCDDTGRHTFDIEYHWVYPECETYGVTRTLRVHIIDVLPILPITEFDYTLPPAAEPGMYLVRLAVHS